LAAAASVLDRRRAELPEEAREPLALLVAEIGRFQRLVVELLELSRAELGSEAAELGPVMVRELLDHAAAAAGCAEGVVDVSPELAATPVVTDKRRVARIVANLLDNAMSYGEGVTRVGARELNGGFEIAVEDRGPGVSEDEREHVFERFFRGTASGRRGEGSGTGLGLALVAEHAAALGGRVRVEAGDDGRGARFVVELPAGAA
jgi:signal transduction histidine kinase